MRRSKYIKKTKSKAWFDRDCCQAKRDTTRAARNLQNKPFDRNLRDKYFVSLKAYKRLLRRKKREHINFIVNSIVNAEKSNPRHFWSSLKSLQGDLNKDFSINDISPASWFKHFKNLNSGHDESSSTILSELSELEKVTTFDELDFHLSLEEIKDSIKTLKNNKATGFDAISNEMLKNCNHKLLLVVQKLFNIVLSSTLYPREWSKGIISTIFKSGNRMIVTIIGVLLFPVVSVNCLLPF